MAVTSYAEIADAVDDVIRLLDDRRAVRDQRARSEAAARLRQLRADVRETADADEATRPESRAPVPAAKA